MTRTAIPPEERQRLVEEAATAWRPSRAGEVGSHPAWHDLDAAGRREVFAVARQLRALEAAADPEGLSATARAVLRRIGAGR
jgi:hypothetical protein